MEPGSEKDWLTKFQCKYKLGNKWVTLFHAEEIQAPGSPTCIIVRRLESKGKRKGKKKVPGRIVVSREQVFNALDEWHHGNGHVGMERTSIYCQEQYLDCTQRIVRMYCTTCFTCMRKNPITTPARVSRKPILSKAFCDRFQLDLIDFCKLRKHDPFAVLMCWVLMIKDHCTGRVYLCAPPCKRPKLVVYKLQEIFGSIGYLKIFHTDNGKEFTGKLILQFLCNLNPNILTVTGRPQQTSDQGSVENMNQVIKRVLCSVLAELHLIGKNSKKFWEQLLLPLIPSMVGVNMMCLLLKWCMANNIITLCCAPRRGLKSIGHYQITFA
jgi:hypothetical protein